MSDSEVRKSMVRIGKAVHSQLPEEWGYFVLVFPFDNDAGRANYASNAQREDVINVMKEFLIQAGHEEDWMKHI